VYATPRASEPCEYASGLALEVLEELRIKVMECRLVLQALPDEADLNFDELERDLHAVQLGARQAYEAASLVHQGAQLDARWGLGWSRPKAIFARHGAAVRQGAIKINPKPTLGDRLERALWQLPTPDRIEDVVGVRPKCSGTVHTTGHKCAVSAIYLGSGLFGAHCYSHATPEERDQYRTHHETVIAAQSDSHARLLGRQRGVGKNITERWLQQRTDRRQWVEAMATATGAAG
jgi:hypothetical protein